MADIHLMQSEADALIAMEKRRVNEGWHKYPTAGSVIIPLESPDKREQFLLDIHRGRIDLLKGKYQNRARQVIVLVRLDFGGAPHRNPDGEEIGSPHLHLYREGYGDKWAVPVPAEHFPRMSDLWATLDDFLRYCQVTIGAVKVLGEPTLVGIARELVETVKKNVTIDWTVRENVRAQLRVIVKRILRKYGYPPDKQERATQTVLEQAALLGAEWALA